MEKSSNNFLIHIGYHKCASTWLQQCMFREDDQLDLLPKAEVSKALVVDDEDRLLSPFDMNSTALRDQINAKFNMNHQLRVLSNERLSGNPHAGGFDSKTIAERIAFNFSKAKVLIIIREQKSWTFSNFFQYLSVGGFRSIKNYLSPPYDGKIPSFSPNHVMYHHLIEHYRNVMGPKNVLVLPYELLVEDETSFSNEIYSFVGLQHREPEKKTIRRNVTKNLFVCYYTRYLNLFTVSSSINNYSFLYSRITSLPFKIFIKILKLGTIKVLDSWVKKRIEQVITDWMQSKYRQSNSLTQKYVDFDLRKYGYEMSDS